MIEGKTLKYMTVAILTTKEYTEDTDGGRLHQDIVIIDDGEESVVIKNRYGSYNMEKRKELHGICVWCNENLCVFVWGIGCGTCPGVPYDCTCDVKDEPHALTCARNPKGPKPRRDLELGSSTFGQEVDGGKDAR